ncbi:MAG: metallophosphatase family protein [candidate division Zixibacteria bacterium]|nr:metallophosphatase family protein [candidate division Zixibacteria bacterium]
MKIALVSDIHGNLEALTAVLREIDRLQVDDIYCLGDVVGYGCDPIACLDLIDKRASVKLMGNHEYAVLRRLSTDTYSSAAKVSTEWTRGQLTDREFTMMADYRMTHDFEDGTLVHSSPLEPNRWQYILDADQAGQVFEHFKGSICFHGHSHLPTIFRETPEGLPRQQAGHDFDPTDDQRYLVNIGSVGQPRDNDPRACFVTYDLSLGEIRFHRTEYDIVKTQEKMTLAKLPDMLVQRLAVGR